MARVVCSVCNIYTYDESSGDRDLGIPPLTPVSSFPESWRCPVCGAPKEKLAPVSDAVFEQGKKAYQGFKTVTGGAGALPVGADTPDVPQEYRQEYGRPLGLRGIGLGRGYLNNLVSLARFGIRSRLISPHVSPDTSTTLLGKEITAPILGAPMSGLSLVSPVTEEDFAFAVLEGCRIAGTIGCAGTTALPYEVHPGIAAALKTGGHGIVIFKPLPQETLIDLIGKAGDAGVIAAGIDIDGAGSLNFARAGKPVFRKTPGDLR
ncbi:MAG: rubredoxin, partial [Methanoregulaceae archaeon]|nr:rubredoxin [Methanoregulaceae archaeon]